LLISYGFGFRIPHAENAPIPMRRWEGHTKLDWAATKRWMRHFHIVLPAKIGNNVEQPFQA
jgi:hypothetical protein